MTDDMEERLKERMDAGDKANRDRIDQLYIDRSEDLEERRQFRREMREDHDKVFGAITQVQAAVATLPSLAALVNDLIEWRELHNKHHGKDDVEIAHRIGVEEGAETTDQKWRRRLSDGLKFLTGGGTVAVLGAIAKLMGKL